MTLIQAVSALCATLATVGAALFGIWHTAVNRRASERERLAAGLESGTLTLSEAAQVLPKLKRSLVGPTERLIELEQLRRKDIVFKFGSRARSSLDQTIAQARCSLFGELRDALVTAERTEATQRVGRWIEAFPELVTVTRARWILSAPAGRTDEDLSEALLSVRTAAANGLRTDYEILADPSVAVAACTNAEMTTMDAHRIR